MLLSFPWKEADIDGSVRQVIASHDRFTVYYGLYDIEKRYADHVAQVLQTENGYTYTISGHGIGHKMAKELDAETLIRRIHVDNRFFNLTEQVHLEISSIEPDGQIHD